MRFLRDDVRVEVVDPADFDAAYLEQLPLVDHAIFVTPDDEPALALLPAYFHVSGPFRSPYPLPPDRAFLMVLARAAN